MTLGFFVWDVSHPVKVTIIVYTKPLNLHRTAVTVDWHPGFLKHPFLASLPGLIYRMVEH